MLKKLLVIPVKPLERCGRIGYTARGKTSAMAWDTNMIIQFDHSLNLLPLDIIIVPLDELLLNGKLTIFVFIISIQSDGLIEKALWNKSHLSKS